MKSDDSLGLRYIIDNRQIAKKTPHKIGLPECSLSLNLPTCPLNP